MGLMQGLPAEEMGYTPLMRGTKEYVRVSKRSNFVPEVIRALQRYAQDQMEFYGRCKRAAVLHDWISGRRLEEIEADFTTMPSPVGLNTATSGDLRTSQGSTCSLRRIFWPSSCSTRIPKRPRYSSDAAGDRHSCGRDRPTESAAAAHARRVPQSIEKRRAERRRIVVSLARLVGRVVGKERAAQLERFGLKRRNNNAIAQDFGKWKQSDCNVRWPGLRLRKMKFVADLSPVGGNGFMGAHPAPAILEPRCGLRSSIAPAALRRLQPRTAPSGRRTRQQRHRRSTTLAAATVNGSSARTP